MCLYAVYYKSLPRVRKILTVRYPLTHKQITELSVSFSINRCIDCEFVVMQAPKAKKQKKAKELPSDMVEINGEEYLDVRLELIANNISMKKILSHIDVSARPKTICVSVDFQGKAVRQHP